MKKNNNMTEIYFAGDYEDGYGLYAICTIKNKKLVKIDDTVLLAMLNKKCISLSEFMDMLNELRSEFIESSDGIHVRNAVNMLTGNVIELSSDFEF